MIKLKQRAEGTWETENNDRKEDTKTHKKKVLTYVWVSGCNEFKLFKGGLS